ncbi:MAG: selenide, water dikinase SelD, partial [Candidatus Marinimicrobia bacterium]|nr:selenide, water dikinase SelD [Candidatus Neomarinimicrobiota bacterium]
MAQVLSHLPKQASNDRVIVGFETADDAAAVRLDNGRVLIQSVDFFAPVVDDPYQFGQIAAANALSDVYAMGANPLMALNIVGFPMDELPLTVLDEILKGGHSKAQEAGIPILGGHTIDDPEPKYGLVVTGEVHESELVRNSTAQPKDVLVLTKPLGTGIIATAIKMGIASDEVVSLAGETMAVLNKAAAEAAREVGVNAMTDVTGYGLLGHLLEMCTASGLSATVIINALPLLPGASELAEK